jgi:flagellar protein FlaF
MVFRNLPRLSIKNWAILTICLVWNASQDDDRVKMGKIIFSIIALVLLVLVGMTGAQNFISFTDDATTGFVDLFNRGENIIRTSIDSVSTTLFPGSQTFEVTLRNRGETRIADFALWDATVQYYDFQNNYHVFRLVYNEGEPGDNQWTVKGIYLDAATGTPEIIEPGVLNPEEEIIIRGKLSPKAHRSNYGLVVIITPNGLKTWNYFSLQSLFLHNYPTPPTENTTAQAALPMDGAVPSASILYNYDSDVDSDPGRMIQKGTGLVDESDLNKYQNWRISVASMVGTDTSGCEIDGDIDLTLWTGMKNFEQLKRGVINAYLRDFDGGSGYTEIASATLDAANWQGGSDTWVETPITFSDVSYTIPVGHYFEVKLVVGDTADDDMWFAYDTIDYQSRIKVP